MSRPFRRERIPECLFRDDTFNLPRLLRDLYLSKLQELSLLEDARENTSNTSIVGGKTREETLRHFAHRFATSAVRVEYLATDPADMFPEVHADLLSTFFDGHISVLDVPCGTGAGILGFLTTLAELRGTGVLPTMPLNIGVIAGDFSDTALSIYSELVAASRSPLRKVGIVLDCSVQNWDASDIVATNALVDAWLSTSEGTSDEHYVLICNLSGVSSSQFSAFRKSIEYIAVRLSNRKSTILWVEPNSSGARGVFSKVRDWIGGISVFSRLVGRGEVRYLWVHPVQGRTYPGTVAVESYKRV